ncbi:hypothetical protein HETIRDRAFT_314450 [Heterobasidion irregulare TC 32-1]|uniref:FAD-binding FR-type domain-containing protein n=1 Tax=Heterobasidion irregulare (strain TC 32-1) TaxID=747525 RepID=W4KDN9_HETIT|nr:uncharacterized protein HETIRDRAFT_314450 [Heterobasidion irregulare TC 32-1]ETW83854.1 hypothetical protein HETIRDRAFT_314450 [Heterobasidion irregulare TC 32-1]
MLRFRYSTAAPAKSSYSYASAIVALAATGGLTAAYFFWPSESRAAPTYRHESISPSHFTPVTLTASEDCGPNLKLLTLTIAPESLPSSSQSSAFWPIWSIFIKDDDIQVERPYTPLEGMDDRGNIKLWVKKYLKGEVGRWLHSKQVGDTVEIRGPLPTFHAYADTWDEIVMISGGTGFSPFYQLLHHQLLQGGAKNKSTRFTLLHGSQNAAELPPPLFLQPLLKLAERHPERLRIRLFIVIPWFRSRKFFDRMIAAIAGPYGRNYSQGAVGGILGDLGFKSGQVWKL